VLGQAHGTPRRVNEDGWIDLITRCEATISIRYGHGDATFSEATNVSTTPYSAGSLLVADENGDGHLDLVFSDPDARVLIVSRGDGHGNFDAPRFYQPTPSIGSPLAALTSGGVGGRDLLVTTGGSGPNVGLLPGRCR